jgi:hypothetical protein
MIGSSCIAVLTLSPAEDEAPIVSANVCFRPIPAISCCSASSPFRHGSVMT